MSSENSDTAMLSSTKTVLGQNTNPNSTLGLSSLPPPCLQTTNSNIPICILHSLHLHRFHNLIPALGTLQAQCIVWSNILRKIWFPGKIVCKQSWQSWQQLGNVDIEGFARWERTFSSSQKPHIVLRWRATFLEMSEISAFEFYLRFCHSGRDYTGWFFHW